MVQEWLESLSKDQGNSAMENAITAQCMYYQATPPHKFKDTANKRIFSFIKNWREVY